MLKTLEADELKILNALAENGLLGNQELASLVKLDEKRVGEIRSELESAGIILKYRAIINWEKIESGGVNAVIQVKVTPAQGQGYDEVARRVAAFPEVRTCLLVSGSFDLLVEVITVGHDYDPRVVDCLVERKRAAQHDHRQRFA